jgi:hypothetical protein
MTKKRQKQTKKRQKSTFAKKNLKILHIGQKIKNKTPDSP